VHNRSPLLFVALLGACARGSIAPSAPRPTQPVSATAAQVVQASDTSRGRRNASDSATRPRIADTSRDTVVLASRGVSRKVLEAFSDSATQSEPSVSDSVAEVSSPTWDIEVREYESTERVDHYVRMFTGSSRDRIVARLERGTRYEPMIRAALRSGGLPEDMYYLALVESGFDNNAYSRAAAVGMWQFMTSTARGVGMRVDWWVDERRDPIRSTIGAVRFLKYLKEQFGSLYLAAAAYNGGPGRIARGLSRYSEDLEGTTGDDLFFALAEKDYLKNETREYVPQLIAAALIAKDPQRFGIEIKAQPPFAYDSVVVAAATPIAAIARAASSSVREIQELNPHLLRGMTPPRGSMQVRIPLGSVAGFDSAFAALSIDDRTAFKPAVTKKNETIYDLAYRTKASVKAINAFNPTLKKVRKTGKLIPGQTVVIPTTAVLAAAVSVPDPEIEKYGSSSSRAVRTHIVRKGESLGLIAKRYGTSVKALMQLNGLKKPMILAGQELLVSGKASAARKPAARKSTTKKSATASRRASGTGAGR
jgi:membrane-bound lytic murein transglycosylase D